jgi:response regulator RpfG family c-di-GMP phosphodiesterase
MEALRLQREECVDLIVAELNLDDMGGDELCTLVRNDNPQRNVAFVLTCRDNPDDLVRGEQSSANALLMRPIQPMQLLKTVGQFLTVQLIRSKRAPLRVRVFSRKDNSTFYCVSHNVSVTGVLLESEERLNLGDRIECQFSLDGSRQIEVVGEVVRSVRMLDGGHQFGIHFIDLKREAYKEIDRYVNATA